MGHHKKRKIDTESAPDGKKVTKLPEAEAVEDSAAAIEYPYPVDDDDHCETPHIAYAHIASLLEKYAATIGKTKDTLQIYDPYFCQGNVVQRLNDLGFPLVRNEMVDFYAAQKAPSSIQNYDVLVTNPPYSLDHMQRLVAYCITTSKPWFLLMPNYVYTKEYFLPTLMHVNIPKLFFIVPFKRYSYTTPNGRRQQKSAKLTSPFPTFWYCSLGSMKHMGLLNGLGGNPNKKDYPGKSISMSEAPTDMSAAAEYCVSRSIKQLPMEVLDQNDSRKKQERNAQKRKKNKERKKNKVV